MKATRPAYACCAVTAALTAAASVYAQTPAPYPIKPVRIITPTAAGGSLDTSARIIAQKLTEMWGQQVTIDNRAGAGGIVGADAAAKSTPDGYTLLFASNGNIATTQALYKKIPYDPLRDFVPVILVAETPYVLIVHPSLPAKNVADLIRLAKAQPGKIDFASSGSGSTPHLAGELFKTMAKVNIVHVPYKGSPAAHTSVMAGETSLEFSGLPSSLGQIKSGKLRALGVAGAKRSSIAQDIPTIAESGLPGYAANSWSSTLVPTGTPAAIVAKLNTDIRAALAAADVRQRMLGQGFEVVGSTPEQFAAYLRSEITKWTKVINDSGAKPD